MMNNNFTQEGQVPRMQYSQSQQGQQQQPTKEGMKLQATPEEFKGTMKTSIMTTMELASIVNSIFKPVCSDFDGSVITGDTATGQLYLSLFFKDKGKAGDNQIKNVINVLNSSSGNSMNDRINRMNTRNANKTYDLTEDTKSILSDFIFTRQGQKINWNQYACEVVDQVAGGYQIYVKVGGLDLIRILRAKYGKKIGGAYHDYQITMRRPLGQQGYYNNNGQDNTNFLIDIVQLNTKMIDELSQKLGMFPTQGSISMVRA